MKKIIILTMLFLGFYLSPTMAQICPVLTEPGAISTGTNTPVTGTCDVNFQVPNNDAKIDFTGIANSEKAEKWEGATYTGPDYNTATGVVTGGAVSFTGLKHATTYTFRFWNMTNACYIDVVVPIPAKNCILPCTPPVVGGNTPTMGTCAGTTPNNDAQLEITGISNVDKVQQWEGTSFGGGLYSAATETVTGSSKTLSGLKPNTTYTFRFWNGNNLCYTDVIRTTPPSDCSVNPIACVNLLDGPVCCPAKICLPVKITKHSN
jgi:hypothetical protein